MAEFFIRHADATQILLFAGAISLLWAIEHLVISLPEGEKLRHTGVNALFALTALPIELVLSAACLAVSRETLDHGLGLVNLFPDPSSVWVRDALVFVALDLFDYLYHRLMHHVHHHNVLPYTDSNFGGVFSVWDRLFGTFAELEAEDTVFGLDTHMEPTTVGDFGSLVAMPFAQPITGASGKSEPTNPSLAGAASALG